MKKIALFTSIASHYRKPIWSLLLEHQKHEFHLFFGDNRSSGIKTIDLKSKIFLKYESRIHKIKNIWYKGKLLFWQRGVLSQCLYGNYDMVVFRGSMYCLSTWIASIICRVKGINIVYWGHGFYGKEKGIKLLIRILFNSLANSHLLYGNISKDLFIKYGFNSKKIYLIYNSLDYSKHKAIRSNFKELEKSKVFNFMKHPDLPTVIFIGRLTATKKLDLLIKAIKTINEDEIKINLVFIGDGYEKKPLINMSAKGISERWIHFLGGIYDESIIGRYIYLSDLCVSPGNVGLTAIHSLSYGTPVCTHDNVKNQMPEAEAIINGYNGIFFKENNVRNLVYNIEYWFSNNTDREKVRQNCYEQIDKYYNPNNQLNTINALIENS